MGGAPKPESNAERAVLPPTVQPAATAAVAVVLAPGVVGLVSRVPKSTSGRRGALRPAATDATTAAEGSREGEGRARSPGTAAGSGAVRRAAHGDAAPRVSRHRRQRRRSSLYPRHADPDQDRPALHARSV